MICSYRRDGIQEIGSREMARRRRPDVLLEVIPEWILHWQASVAVVPYHPVIDAPQVAGSHLSQMAHYYRDARKAVEDAIHTHSENMSLQVLTKLEGRDTEPPSGFPQLFLEVR